MTLQWWDTLANAIRSVNVQGLDSALRYMRANRTLAFAQWVELVDSDGDVVRNWERHDQSDGSPPSWSGAT